MQQTFQIGLHFSVCFSSL